ncbi:hypothetical protein CAPTEDRAFT_50637, partial [Capitella teleta]
CAMPMAAGTGNTKATKYYYDAKTETCIKFKYSGAGGNENNFDSKADCEQSCGP